MKKILLTLMIALLCIGCASAPVTTATGKDKTLKTFPVMVGEKRVMDVRFQYLGNKPMDPAKARGIPPDKMKYAHFYYFELVNLTDHTMEIFAYHSTGRMISVDESGNRKESPSRWLTRDELVRTWGLKGMRIEARERQIHKDSAIFCQMAHPSCKVVRSYKIRILETDETFMVKIVKKG